MTPHPKQTNTDNGRDKWRMSSTKDTVGITRNGIAVHRTIPRASSERHMEADTGREADRPRERGWDSTIPRASSEFNVPLMEGYWSNGATVGVLSNTRRLFRLCSTRLTRRPRPCNRRLIYANLFGNQKITQTVLVINSNDTSSRIYCHTSQSRK